MKRYPYVIRKAISLWRYAWDFLRWLSILTLDGMRAWGDDWGGEEGDLDMFGGVRGGGLRGECFGRCGGLRRGDLVGIGPEFELMIIRRLLCLRFCF